MKILILIIYNDDADYYRKMFELQNEYINNNENVDVYFIKYNNKQKQPIVEQNNLISIYGNEKLLNIIHKTIVALDFLINLKNKNYDFIVRTNISTLININNLRCFLNECDKYNVYTGSKLENLQWYDEKSGINYNSNLEHNLMGLRYMQGHSIIMSIDVVQCLLKNRYNINHAIVDDVTIGMFIRDFRPDIYNKITETKLCKVSYNSYSSDSVFIRNNLFTIDNVNRHYDIERMTNIVYFYYKKQLYENCNIEKTTKIPNNIHLIHKDISLLNKSAFEWKKLNPNYNVILYDDEACLEFLLTYYGKQYCDIFNFIQHGAIKCDFFRICLLYIYGGIYADSDISPVVPLNEYLTDDIDFATCISYNYKENYSLWNYNPQFIVSHNYDKTLLQIINKYVNLYVSKSKYEYWTWSICNLFDKIDNFQIELYGDNIFTFNEKKYKFFIEEFVDISNNIYNFTNRTLCNDNDTKIIDFYIKDKNKIIFHNFKNK